MGTRRNSFSSKGGDGSGRKGLGGSGSGSGSKMGGGSNAEEKGKEGEKLEKGKVEEGCVIA
eukprot:3636743-Pyramimonas_sp.AAC.1